MKRLFALLLVTMTPALAEESAPVDSIRWGSVEVVASPRPQGKAQLSACWQEAQGQADEHYWRASLEEAKVELQAGVQRQVGPAEVEVQVAQAWEEELENRRAQLRLSVPYQGWVLGGSAEMDWQRPEDVAQWESQPGLYQTWLQSPRWGGASARASWQRSAQEQRSQLALEYGRGQLVAEVATQDLTAQRRWLARFQLDLRRDARLATEVSRRWQDGWAEPESRVEARLEVHF